MKKVTYFCDKCGAEIADVVYELCCWAEDVGRKPLIGMSADVVSQNTAQNKARQETTRHLCRSCKDLITDGIFVV